MTRKGHQTLYDEVEAEDHLQHLKNGAWLDQQKFPPLSWAVPGLIPEGFGLFTGPPKAGKSWAALDIALAVASGSTAFGIIATGKARPVLLLALEDGDRRLQGRCRHLLGEGKRIPALLDYQTTPEAVFVVMEAWLAKHGHRRPLVVLDTLGKVMPSPAPGVSAYQHDYRVGSRLKTLVDHHPGATLLVVHHVRKALSADWMDSTSGTNGLNGAADWTLNLHRPRNETRGVIRVTGRDVPENEYAVTNESGAWRLNGNSLDEAAANARTQQAAEGVSDRSGDIVQLLAQHPAGLGPTEIGKKIGVSAANAGQYLSRLADSGRITRRARGKYVLAATATTFSGDADVIDFSQFHSFHTPPEE